MFNNKRIFVTGGTGSFGKKFIKTILSNWKPEKIIVYSRDELKQFEMQKYWPDNGKFPIRYFIGDIRDFSRLDMAMQGVDYVVHRCRFKTGSCYRVQPI